AHLVSLDDVPRPQPVGRVLDSLQAAGRSPRQSRQEQDRRREREYPQRENGPGGRLGALNQPRAAWRPARADKGRYSGAETDSGRERERGDKLLTVAEQRESRPERDRGPQRGHRRASEPETRDQHARDGGDSSARADSAGARGGHISGPG